MHEIIIIGAGGQAKNTSLIVEQAGHKVLGFADDDPNKQGLLRKTPIFGSVAKVLEAYEKISFVFAIGNPHVVSKIVNQIRAYHALHPKKIISFPNIIHPTVALDQNEVVLGEGNIFFPGVLLLADIHIGNFNFFNFNSAVSHEVTVGNYCIIQPGVNLLGQTKVCDFAYCGANSTIIQAKIIGQNATVGAGAVVTKDVDANTIVVGNPARLLRHKET